MRLLFLNTKVKDFEFCLLSLRVPSCSYTVDSDMINVAVGIELSMCL